MASEAPREPMSSAETPASGPDLALGVRAADLADGAMLAGHVGDEAVLLTRCAGEFLAISGTCTHYNGPLADGIVDGDTVRCPWHHACFSLRTGEALRAPALSPVACWAVELIDGKVMVRGKKVAPERRGRGEAGSVAADRTAITGGGAAGFAAAEMLRREGFQGGIVMLSDDAAA